LSDKKRAWFPYVFVIYSNDELDGFSVHNPRFYASADDTPADMVAVLPATQQFSHTSIQFCLSLRVMMFYWLRRARFYHKVHLSHRPGSAHELAELQDT
jgi:hypothetical protein